MADLMNNKYTFTTSFWKKLLIFILLQTELICDLVPGENTCNITSYADKNEVKENEGTLENESSCDKNEGSSAKIDELNFEKLSIQSPEKADVTMDKAATSQENYQKVPAFLGCRNESGDLEKYFVAYKLPDGDEFIVKYPGKNLRFSSHGVLSDKSMLAKTLKPIFDKRNKIQSDVNYLIWNHVEYGAKNSKDYPNFGHSKGVLAFNKHGGFLMVHTVPKFMSNSLNNYEYPSSGIENGQIALCVTLKPDEKNPKEYLLKLRTFIRSIRSFRPKLQETLIDPFFDEEITTDENLLWAQQTGNLEYPVEQEETWMIFTSKFNVHFFSRYEKLQNNHDMRYDAFAKLAFAYKTSLHVQSWNRLGWDSYCTNDDYTIENLIKFKFSWKDSRGNNKEFRWNTGSDHSKWAISKNTESPLVCIGDLNRFPTTMRRGGLFVCTTSVCVYDALYSVVTHYEGEIGN